MIVCKENPKQSQKKTARSNNNKVRGYKINTQKSTAFLYTDNKHAETKIKNITIYNHSRQN